VSALYAECIQGSGTWWDSEGTRAGRKVPERAVAAGELRDADHMCATSNNYTHYTHDTSRTGHMGHETDITKWAGVRRTARLASLAPTPPPLPPPPHLYPVTARGLACPELEERRRMRRSEWLSSHPATPSCRAEPTTQPLRVCCSFDAGDARERASHCITTTSTKSPRLDDHWASDQRPGQRRRQR
jgi:hypothetical protein